MKVIVACFLWLMSCGVEAAGYMGNLTQTPTDTLSVQNFGAIGDGIHDDTVAIQAALDAVLSIGNSDTTTNTLRIPSGNYRVTFLTLGYIQGSSGSPLTRDVYHKNIVAEGKIIGTNPNGAVLNIEGMSGVNILGLRVINTETLAGSISVKASRSYAVNWFGGQFEGGSVAFQLQGNNNNFFGSQFVNAGTGFLITGNTENSVNNTLWGADIERNKYYGINLNRTAGSMPSLTVRNSYFESISPDYLADIRVSNVTDVVVDNNYFAFNTSHDGIVYAGTIAPSKPSENRNTVSNNMFQFNEVGLRGSCIARESGTPDVFMRFVRYSNNAITGHANPNTVMGASQAYEGTKNSGMSYSINLEGQRRAVYSDNFDFLMLGNGLGLTASGWLFDGGGSKKHEVTASQNGYGNALLVANGHYAHKDVRLKGGSLYSFSVWVNMDTPQCSAQMELWTKDISAKKAQTTTSSSTTSRLLEGWFYNPLDAELKILLRNQASVDCTVGFSEVRITDLTN